MKLSYYTIDNLIFYPIYGRIRKERVTYLRFINKFNHTYFNTKVGRYIFFTIITSIFLVLLISRIITDNEIASIKKYQYQSYSNTIKNKLAQFLENKKEVMSFIALSLSHDTNIINALKRKDKTLITLKEFSSKLKNLTIYKNVWFQIIDAEGNSFYRSWSSNCGENMLTFRLDIKQMIKNPKIMSTISTGKHAMTFKSMVPIYDNHKFIGIFEIITHFNSIQKKMQKENVETIFLVDKSYKKQITQPFSKMFIDDYYSTLLNPNKELITLLKNNGVNNYISNEDYLIDHVNNYFITTYPIADINGDKMGYALIFRKLDSFQMQEIHYIEHNTIASIIVIVLLIILFGYYLMNKRHEEYIIAQHKEHEKEIEKNTKFLTIGQMAAGITHEINTPLTYIKGTNEMSKYELEDMPNNKFKKTLLQDNQKIDEGIDRIRNIVESMREMSQVNNLQKEDTNIYATMITTLRLINNRAKQISKIYINDELFEVNTSQNDKHTFTAHINKQKIEQVWTIILNNSLDELIKIDDYEMRKIEIFINSKVDSTEVIFQDNGGGIDNDIIDVIFEPFVSNKLASGIGIGMNVAKKILDEHQAQIEVKNKNGGAYFKIIFKK